MGDITCTNCDTDEHISLEATVEGVSEFDFSEVTITFTCIECYGEIVADYIRKPKQVVREPEQP